MRKNMPLFINACLALFATVAPSIAAEKEVESIPLRNPAIGESRPGWWWYCWTDNVIVVDGSIVYTETKADEVRVEISTEALEKHYSRKDRELQRTYSSFYIAELTIDKLLFAAPGLEKTDLSLGHVRTMKVLLPSMAAEGFGHIVPNLEAGKPNKGTFIFRYGTSVFGIHFVYRDLIRPEQMTNASKVFAYRRKFDHTKNAVEAKPNP
jgi:hypothetical protein